jgi:hypothetical protein
MVKVRKVLNLVKLMLVLGIIGNIVGVLHIGTWAANEREASARYVGAPLSVRLVGTLYSPDQKKAGGLKTLKVTFEKQNWVFDLEKLVVLSSNVTEMKVLQALRPYRLLLSGPAEVLSVLQGAEMIGKPLTIRGYLYMSHQRLMVNSIEAVSEEGD